MKILSEIFLVTFSILYGTMLNSCVGLNLFPVGRRSCKDKCVAKKVWLRLSLSVLIINVLPFLFFSYVFVNLENLDISTITGADFLRIFGVFLLSTGVFGFYRIIHLFIVLWHRRLYSPDMEGLPDSTKERLDFARSASIAGNLFGIVFYLLVLVALGWCLVSR